MYILLTGAIKNVGDFLIAERGKKLLQQYKPDKDIYEISRYEKLENYEEVLAKAEAIILCGGPGFSINMYPQVFALMSDLSKINVPIISLGLGWWGIPGDTVSLNTYKFAQSSKGLLNKLSNDFPYIGCRDYYTVRALKNNGYRNAIMTGCPAWYDLDYIDNDFDKNQNIKKVVVSTPAGPSYFNQCLQLMDWVKGKYLGAELYCTFHRGIEVDQYTDFRTSDSLIALRTKAKEMGYNVLDLSYDLNKMSIYDEADIHIGYRVHAHLYCMSHRKRSILIHEDGRGTACSHALGLEGVDAFTAIYDTKVGRYLVPNSSILEELSLLFEEIEANDFRHFDSVKTTMISTFINMEKFINTLP